MKNKEEITRARHHMRQAAEASLANGDEHAAVSALTMADVLCWVLDEPNRFGAEVFEPCDLIDKHKREARAN